MSARNIALTWETPAYATDCEFTQGEAILLTYTRDSTTTILAWTITCYIKKYHDDATPVLTLTGAITVAASGIFTLSLTAAQTLALEEQSYVAQAWRTDSGSETILSNLSLNVLEGQ